MGPLRKINHLATLQLSGGEYVQFNPQTGKTEAAEVPKKVLHSGERIVNIHSVSCEELHPDLRKLKGYLDSSCFIVSTNDESTEVQVNLECFDYNIGMSLYLSPLQKLNLFTRNRFDDYYDDVVYVSGTGLHPKIARLIAEGGIQAIKKLPAAFKEYVEWVQLMYDREAYAHDRADLVKSPDPEEICLAVIDRENLKASNLKISSVMDRIVLSTVRGGRFVERLMGDLPEAIKQELQLVGMPKPYEIPTRSKQLSQHIH